jgi:hypothetical protein
VADLLITKTRTGVAMVKTTDPFSSLEVHRVDRSAWDACPAQAGVYLLYGFVDGEPAAYVGMSTTSMRDRIRTHHVTPRKNWFGVLFAIPLSTPLLCPAIEAEMIRRVREAGVVGVIDNRAQEDRWLDADDVHVTPALDGIVGALEMLLGNDIFTPPEGEDGPVVVDVPERPTRLARSYKGRAQSARNREELDPANATHAYVGAGIRAWGHFEADEPDTSFRVLAGSVWRRPNLEPSQASYAHQARVASRQEPLIDSGVLDAVTMTFARDHVFDNWSQAVGVVSGKGSYSGGYHWQLIHPVVT